MTSNEKKVLAKFKEIKQGNTVTMAATLRSSINYAYDVCKKLCERGYIERLSPGRFALYKITPSGEEQVRGEGGNEREFKSVVGVEEDKKEVEGIEEYECVSCGATAKEDDTNCPKCGIIFEEGVEEKEVTESLDSFRDEGVLPSSRQGSEERSLPERGRSEGSDSIGKETGILVPEDWKTCNWKWK